VLHLDPLQVLLAAGVRSLVIITAGSGDVDEASRALGASLLRYGPRAAQENRKRTANPDLPRFVYPNGKRSEIFYVGTFGTPEEGE
jgi:hypothetical protein